jgi:Ca-activated chloride channel family protein
MVVLLVLGGLAAGYVYVVRAGCSGDVRATIVASPSTASILQSLGSKWAATEPSVHARCASVEVLAKDSADMAVALGNEWDPKTGGPAPDVWVPQSSAWVRRAAASSIAEPMIPDLQPSIARSPTVIAMPRPMAEVLGWPKASLTWQDVIDKFATNKAGWAQFGKDWGAFRFGMSDPAKSTAGLLALTAMFDANDDSEIDDAEQQSVLRLKQVMKVYKDNTEQIMQGYDGAGGQGGDAGLKYLSAFPALEQDVLAHNLSNPGIPLVAIYPSNGNIEADHPYLILKAPWVTPERRDVAAAFMAYVRGPEGQAALLNAGFRDPNRRPGKDLTEQYGLSPTLTALPRAVLLPDSVSRTIDTWTALTRPTNLLLVLDISGSMKTEVPGTGKTRMDLAKQAAKKAVALFPDDAQVGLWAFSTRQNGTKDYRTVVSLGRVGDTTDNGRTRQQEMLARIDALTPTGDTGLYDTVAAAQQTLLNNYDKGSTNLVVLMTDGKNDDPGGGLSLSQLSDKLQKAPKDKPVSVVTVAFGEEADYAVLSQISSLTGTRAFSAKDEFDINDVLSTAVFAGG